MHLQIERQEIFKSFNVLSVYCEAIKKVLSNPTTYDVNELEYSVSKTLDEVKSDMAGKKLVDPCVKNEVALQ